MYTFILGFSLCVFSVWFKLDYFRYTIKKCISIAPTSNIAHTHIHLHTHIYHTHTYIILKKVSFPIWRAPFFFTKVRISHLKKLFFEKSKYFRSYKINSLDTVMCCEYMHNVNSTGPSERRDIILLQDF